MWYGSKFTTACSKVRGQPLIPSNLEKLDEAPHAKKTDVFNQYLINSLER